MRWYVMFYEMQWVLSCGLQWSLLPLLCTPFSSRVASEWQSHCMSRLVRAGDRYISVKKQIWALLCFSYQHSYMYSVQIFWNFKETQENWPMRWFFYTWLFLCPETVCTWIRHLGFFFFGHELSTGANQTIRCWLWELHLAWHWQVEQKKNCD